MKTSATSGNVFATVSVEEAIALIGRLSKAILHANKYKSSCISMPSIHGEGGAAKPSVFSILVEGD